MPPLRPDTAHRGLNQMRTVHQPDSLPLHLAHRQKSESRVSFIQGERDRLQFHLPMLPPSVNHYVTHTSNAATGKVIHRKNDIAVAYEASFMAMLPARIRGCFVLAEFFSITLRIVPAPRAKGDIDNYPKMVLDCIAKAGMLRRPTSSAIYPHEECGDSRIKSLHVYLDDTEEDRKHGPELWVTIEAYERNS